MGRRMTLKGQISLCLAAFFLALAIALCNIAADLVQWAIGRKKGVA